MEKKSSLKSNILYLQICNDEIWKKEKNIQSWLKTIPEEKLFSLFMEIFVAYNEDKQSLPSLVNEEIQLENKIKYNEKLKPSSPDTDMDELKLKIHISELVHERLTLRKQIVSIEKEWSFVIKERLEKISDLFFSLPVKSPSCFYQVMLTPRPGIKEQGADRSLFVSRRCFESFFDLKTNEIFLSPFLQILFSGRLLGMKNQQPCILDNDEGFLFLHNQKIENSLSFSEIFPNTSELEKATLRQSLLKEVLFVSSLWSHYDKMGKCSADYYPIVFKKNAGLNEEENMEDVVFSFGDGNESLLPLSMIPEVFDFSLMNYREKGILKTRRMKEQPKWLTILNPFSFSNHSQLYLPVLSPEQDFCNVLEEKAGRKAILFLQMKEIEFASLLLFDKVESSACIFPF